MLLLPDRLSQSRFLLLCFVLAQLCAGTVSAYQVLKHQPIIDHEVNNNIALSSSSSSRRRWLHSTTSGLLGLSLMTQPPTFALAATSPDKNLIKFLDEECGFEVLVPGTWEKTEQRLPAPDRRKLVLFLDPTSPPTEKTLVFLAYTPVRDDFTSLSSFGSVDQVAQTTILPKGAIAGEDTESAMLSAESKKQAYFFDYRAKPPGQVETHFRTIFSLTPGATGGAGSLLVTITAQTPEARYPELKPMFDIVIDSYGKIAA